MHPHPLKKIRIKMGLSQAKMGLLLGITGSMVSQVENGTIDLPAKYIDALARLGVDPGEYARQVKEWKKTVKQQV